jgi:hypothetical protein
MRSLYRDRMAAQRALLRREGANAPAVLEEAGPES